MPTKRCIGKAKAFWQRKVGYDEALAPHGSQPSFPPIELWHVTSIALDGSEMITSDSMGTVAPFVSRHFCDARVVGVGRYCVDLHEILSARPLPDH